jgi:PAS domain S-box-containing protein
MSQHASVVGAPLPATEARERDHAGGLDRLVAEVPLPLALVALLGVYLLGMGASFYTPEGSPTALWWPAAGLGVAIVLLAPRRSRWLPAIGVAAASALAMYTGDQGPVPAAGLGLSTGVEALLVAWLLTRGRDERPSLRTMQDLWRFVAATAAGTAVVALGLVLATVYAGGSSVSGALAGVGAHAAAVLVLTPLVMQLGPAALGDRYLEALLQWILLLVTVAYVFSPGQSLSLGFLALPLLLWAALRFGVRIVANQLVVVAIMTTTLTAAGGGPFALGAATGITAGPVTAGLVQAFLAVTTLVALPLAVAVDQRRTALTRVSANEELFRKGFGESFVGMLLLSLSPRGLRIRELNQTAADLLGGEVEELTDDPFEPLLDTATSWKEVARRIGEGDLDGWREELWLARQPGRRVALALSPMSTAGEEPLFSAQLMDLTQVHEATSRLSTEKGFTEAILSTTAALIVVVDVDGHIAGINPAAEKVSGFGEADVLDKPVWETLAPPTDRRRLRDLLEQTRPGRELPGRTPRFEGDLVTTSGGRRRIVWSAAPLIDESGRRSHVVLTGIDVTDERNVRSMTGHLLDAATSTSFVGLDLMGTITIFNTGAQELLGYTAEEVTGRLRLEDLHDPDEIALVSVEQQTLPGFPTIIAGVDAGPRTRDWTYVRKDGSRVACAVTMSEVRDAFGALIGYLAVGRDVTEYQRSQKLLVESLEMERAAVESLREANQVRDDFVSVVSHELRTPITSIVGYTEMLEDGTAGPLSYEQTRLLDTVHRNGDRLLALIDDLLTLSRIESGTFTLETTSVDLRMVLNRCQEAVRSMLEGRSLEVGFDAPDHPVLVMGDFPQLERAVLNLLSNAVKFTEDNGRVHCSVGVSEGLAEVVVSDTGVGIPEDEQPQLFTRFFRGRVAQEFAVQGTGLGLSIVQSIVHSHGGEVSIRSSEYVGTEVRLALPLLPAKHRLDPGRR